MTPSRRLGLTLALIVVVGMPLIAACGNGASRLDTDLNAIVAPYRFRAVAWEVCALFGVGCDGADVAALPDGLADADALHAFFELADARRDATARLRSAAEDGDDAAAAALDDSLAEIAAQRAALRGRVEAIIAREVRAALVDEGITHPLADRVPIDVTFPPVSLRLEHPPTLLVVSPRERIESLREVMLLQGLGDATREEIEAAVAALGYSGLVVDLGGLAALYPPLIDQDAPLDWTVETAVHEWLHQYLAFTPFGFRYVLDLAGLRRDYEIATMNETAVGMLGREIAGRVLANYLPPPAPRDETPTPAPSESLFNQTMRETRLRVDALLAQGQVTEAEAYMEEQRRYLVSEGFALRKLNQAYFAFHGAYADAPTSVSPIGEEMRALRRRATSPGAFLRTVAGFTNRADLQQALSEAAVTGE